MHEVFHLIHEHGNWFYLITFVWTALEGETFVVFAALAAQRGFLNIELLFMSAWTGSMCGDQVFFLLGRYCGNWIVARFPGLRPKLAKVFGWLEKHAAAFVLSYRFMYGIRNVSGIAVGMSRLAWNRFAGLNALASFLWAMAFCSAGYLFGDVIEHFGHRKEEVVDTSIRGLMLSVLALFACVLLVRYAVFRWQRRKMAAIQEEINKASGPDICEKL
jgi:membrane protein DedA with SNARE-associated domain